MIKKIANFHSEAVKFFEELNENFIPFLQGHSVNFFLLATFIFTALFTNQITIHVNQKNTIENTIQGFLLDNNEKLKYKAEGNSYDTKDGKQEAIRVYSNLDTYQFYFVEDELSTPYIYSEIKKEWLTQEPFVSPVISEAFTYYDIGVVQGVKGNKVIADNNEYVVENVDFGISIEGIGTYSPLPAMTKHVQRFVENYTDSPIHELTPLNISRSHNKEVIFFKDSEATYGLNIYFDDSAQLGLVEDKDIEKIE